MYSQTLTSARAGTIFHRYSLSATCNARFTCFASIVIPAQLTFRRFRGMTLHCSRLIPSLKCKSLETLTRLTERATAKNLKAALERQLEVYGLEITDFSGVSTVRG